MTKNMQLSGTSIAPGLAVGKAFVYRDVLEENLRTELIPADQIEVECERAHQAADKVLAALENSASRVSRQIGTYHGEIFEAHQLVLRELMRSRGIRQEIKKERVKAEVAVQRVFHRWVHKIEADESVTFTRRAEDVADLGRQLIWVLKGVSIHPLESMPKSCVLVARRLFPSDALLFSQRDTAGIVIEIGGWGSHCALLTRQLGIPGVANVLHATDRIHTGNTIILDGFRGQVILEPDEEARHRLARRIKEHRRRYAKANARCREPAITKDGVHVSVMANIASQADAQVACDNGADGVGLFRLEALFMLHKSLPTEHELLDKMSLTIAPLRDKPVIVRLLDVGSDKKLPYFEFDAEPAPCLGRRGVRVLRAYPELLNAQLRALLRLSQTHSVQIMIPMVTTPEDVRAIRCALESQSADLGIAEIPPIVAMIETPAAALRVPAILRFANVLSLGTNDLTQYVMAAGRQNPLVHHYFKEDDPAVLRLVRLAAKEAGDALVGVCGELAGQPDAVPMLLSAGVRLLSVAPPLVPSIKEAVRQVVVAQNDSVTKTRKPFPA